MKTYILNKHFKDQNYFYFQFLNVETGFCDCIYRFKEVSKNAKLFFDSNNNIMKEIDDEIVKRF